MGSVRASAAVRAMLVLVLLFPLMPISADVLLGSSRLRPVVTPQVPLRPRPEVLAAQPSDPVLLKPVEGLTLAEVARRTARELGAAVKLSSRVPGWATAQVPRGFTTDEVLAAMERAGVAQVASRHARFHALYQPNDPYAVDVIPGGDEFEPELGQYYLFQVSAPQAWDLQRGSHSVKLAVLDSGISLYHEDLYGNMWHNAGEIPGNGVDDDGNGYVDDYWGWDLAGPNVGSLDEMYDPDTYMDLYDEYPTVWDPDWWLPDYPFSTDPAIGDGEDNSGNMAADEGVTHGTMVAGIANAVTDNGMDTAGVAFNVQTIAVRVMNPEGWGWDEDLAAGLIYAADVGADVINLSLSFGRRENVPEAVIEMVEEAIRYAVDRGCIIVSAAGNSRGEGDYYGGLDFPADMPETIAVGAVDYDKVVSGYSNWALEGEVLDVVAPGDLLLTSSVLEMATWGVIEMLMPGEFGLGEDLLDVALGGTSFSTPIVSGYAALLRSRYSRDFITYEMFREILRASSEDLGEPGYDPDYGWGHLNMYAGIQYADGRIPEPGTLALMGLGVGVLGLLRRRRRAA